MFGGRISNSRRVQKTFKRGESAALFYPDLQICSAPANLKRSRRENWDTAADYKTLKKYLTKYRYRTFLLLIQNKLLIHFAEFFCIGSLERHPEVIPSGELVLSSGVHENLSK